MNAMKESCVARISRCTAPALLLALPTAAVAVASLGFVVGLSLSRWMPLAAFAGVTAWGLFRGARRAVGVAWGLFALCGVLSLWGNGVAMYDYRVYHHPAATLMAEGWNPFWGGTVEGLAALGVPVGELNALHAVHLCHGAQLFAAMALQWTGLFCGGVALAWVAFWVALSEAALAVLGGEGPGRRWRVGALGLFTGALFLLTWGSAAWAPADLAQSLFFVAFALAGQRAVRGERAAWAVAVPSAAWCCALKFTGLAWVAAGGAALGLLAVRRKTWGEALRAGAAALTLALAMGAAPYLSNTLHRGGPFWPLHTLDARWPKVDLTADLARENADAARMGWWARMAYAYLSPAGVAAVLREGEAPFRPTLRGDADDRALAGFGPWHRALFLPAVLCAALIPGLRRRVGPAVAVLMLAFLLTPLRAIGYGRYAWFALPLPALVFAIGAGAAPMRAWGRWLCLAGLLSAFGLVVPGFVRGALFAPAERLAPLLETPSPPVCRDLSAKPWAFAYRTPRLGDAGFHAEAWLRRHRDCFPEGMPSCAAPVGAPGPDGVFRWRIPPPRPTLWQALAVPPRYAWGRMRANWGATEGAAAKKTAP